MLNCLLREIRSWSSLQWHVDSSLLVSADLLLAAIIATSISTADSQLLVASSSFTADLYKPFFRKKATEKETLFVGRVLVLVLSLIAFVIANSKGSGAQAIMDMVENAWGAFGASFGPTSCCLCSGNGLIIRVL